MFYYREATINKEEGGKSHAIKKKRTLFPQRPNFRLPSSSRVREVTALMALPIKNLFFAASPSLWLSRTDWFADRENISITPIFIRIINHLHRLNPITGRGGGQSDTPLHFFNIARKPLELLTYNFFYFSQI